MEVDYTGLTLTLVDPESGETRPMPVFVTVLPANDYLYAEVQPCLEKFTGRTATCVRSTISVVFPRLCFRQSLM
jgi:hypothetical protein